MLINADGGAGISAGVQALRDGTPLVEAVESALRAVEADPRVRTVGRGGRPNVLGELELDASIMDGTTRRTGSVGALRGFLHPISVARKVMEELPHEILVGEGAARFAEEHHAERAELLTEESKAEWQSWLEQHLPDEVLDAWPEVPLTEWVRLTSLRQGNRDTVVILAQDSDRNIVSATSTSGWAYKYPGRLGDSPIVGAGHYAHSRYGAAACTHTGEMTIRAGTARSVVLYLKVGMSLEEACYEALADLRELVGGHLGDVVLHAIDKDGQHAVFSMGVEASYWIWSDEAGMEGPELRPAVVVPS